MTNLNDAQDARSQIDAVDDLDMASLRKVTKLLGISAQRDWSKEDFIAAIKAKQENVNAPSLVFDNSLAPKPGYARIIIHRDNSPGHKNPPIHAGINGRIFSIPRGVEVDIPEPLVGVLSNARSLVLRQTDDNEGRTTYKDSMTQSYPFQVLAVTPGKFENNVDGRAANFERRKAFNTKFGRWPTKGELEEAMRHRIANEM